MSVQIQDSQQVPLSVNPEDSAGNTVPDTGALSWSVDDATLINLVDNGDGTFTAKSTGKLGTAVVSVSDVEPSPDGTIVGATFLGTVSIDVVTGPVSQIVVNAGAAVPLA